MFFGWFFGHNSSYTNSFWLRLFMGYATYHVQLLTRTRYSRKFIGKNVGGSKILHISENHEFQCFGDVFGGVCGGLSCAARTIVYQIECLKWLVELVSKSGFTFWTGFVGSVGEVWQRWATIVCIFWQVIWA